jgi:hypothetical protein
MLSNLTFVDKVVFIRYKTNTLTGFVMIHNN